MQHPGGAGSSVWDGRDDSGAFVPNGKYGIAVFATDSCGNESTAWVAVQVGSTTTDDMLHRTPDLILRRKGNFMGPRRMPLLLPSAIVEENLDVYSLRYGSGDNPAQWTELLTGNILPIDPQLFEWPVGRDDGIPDGLYTLSLYARDLGGLEAEARVRVFIDNTPPEVSVTSPQEGSYVKEPGDISGSAPG